MPIKYMSSLYSLADALLPLKTHGKTTRSKSKLQLMRHKHTERAKKKLGQEPTQPKKKRLIHNRTNAQTTLKYETNKSRVLR